MSEKTFFEDYVESLEFDIEKTSRHIVSGKCVDFAEYLAKCREVKAYEISKQKFLASFKRYFREETEDHLKPEED